MNGEKRNESEKEYIRRYEQLTYILRELLVTFAEAVNSAKELLERWKSVSILSVSKMW